MFSSRCAEEPLHAIELARTLRPHLLLLDVELPGIDGLELLQRLRADESMRTIPAIAVSAGAMPGDIRKALDAGFAAYLTKPLELGELLQAVRRHLPDSAQAGRIARRRVRCSSQNAIVRLSRFQPMPLRNAAW